MCFVFISCDSSRVWLPVLHKHNTYFCITLCSNSRGDSTSFYSANCKNSVLTAMRPRSLLLHHYSTRKSGENFPVSNFSMPHFTVRSSPFRPHLCLLISLAHICNTHIIGQQDCNPFHHNVLQEKKI